MNWAAVIEPPPGFEVELEQESYPGSGHFTTTAGPAPRVVVGMDDPDNPLPELRFRIKVRDVGSVEEVSRRCRERQK